MKYSCEKALLNQYVETALDEADQSAEQEVIRLTHEEVFGKMRKNSLEKNGGVAE